MEAVQDTLLTVSEVAAVLKTNVDYVYKLQRAGLLRFLKLGRLKCRRSTLDAFLEKYDGMDVSDPFHVKELSETEDSL